MFSRTIVFGDSQAIPFEREPVMNVQVTGTAKVVEAGTNQAVILLSVGSPPDAVIPLEAKGEQPRVVDPTSSVLLPGVTLRLS